MKTTKFLVIIIGASIIACNDNVDKHNTEVKTVNEHEAHATKKIDAKVDNELDPVCKMATAEFLTDTVHYAGNVYGFCSASCKSEFEKNPETYIK